MIKKLQALKAKKGFTLVELIVVIAIIGVLAAILVPTLLGVVTRSRVTSADSTAKSIKDQIDTFLSQADADGYGMKAVSTNMTTITFEVDNAGKWTVTVDATDMFKSRAVSSGDVAWAATGSATSGDARTTGADPTALLALSMADTFPEMKRTAAIAYLVGGKNCVFLAYTADTADADELASEVNGNDLIDTTTYTVAATSTWDGHNAGIGGTEGFTVGTSPKVNID